MSSRNKEKSWRQTSRFFSPSRYLGVKSPLQLLVKIGRMHWGCSSILQISPSPVWTSALWSVGREKNASLPGQGDKFVPLVFAQLTSQGGDWGHRPPAPWGREEAFRARGQKLPQALARNPCLPKIPGIPYDCLRLSPESGWKLDILDSGVAIWI